MFAYHTRRARALPFRTICRFLVLAIFASSLSACLDDDTLSSSAPPTRTRATALPKTPKPATPKPSVTSAPADPADWTVLVYLDGDNNLEAEAIEDYTEMATVGSTAQMNIIVQFDRISSDEDWDNTSNGNWRGVKRFRVERGKKPTKANQLADLGELNMGDPSTLVDFTTWGIQSYPAQHYALIFWDHGSSWPGVANDDSSDDDMLTLPEIADAFAEVRENTGVQKLDLIGFDACLMGQIDVLQAIAPYGDVAIGSADLEPGSGWAWNAWLSDLADNPIDDAATLAPSIIKSFTAFYKQEDDSSVTLAAFDLNKVEKMASQLDALAQAMIQTMPGSFKTIGRARSYAAEYASGDTDISAIDLGYFADSLITAGAEQPIASAARALSKTIKSARIAQGFGADHPKSSGISVYFPRKKKHYDTAYMDASPLTQATHWDEFLQIFYAGGKTNTAKPQASKPKLNTLVAQPDAPIKLQATITGDDTAYVYYFVGGIDPNDSNIVQIMSMDYLYPPGAVLNSTIPDWRDGDAVQLTWRSSSWYMSNAADVVLVPFIPVEYGSSTYSVDGIYTSSKTGKETPVNLEFAVTQDRGSLQHIWAFDKDSNNISRPRELNPKAGDTFTPSITAYNDNSNNADDEQSIAGTSIVFSNTPMIVFRSDAPSGEYVIGLMVENLAGDVTDQYEDVTVHNPAGTALPTIPDAPTAPQAGATHDTLVFYDEQRSFQIEYPNDWAATSPGNDKAVFTNPDDPDGAYVGVDVYELEGKLTNANRAMINDLLDVDRELPGWEMREDMKTVRLAHHDAMRVEYVYEDQDGVQYYVIGIAVSDKTTESTYLITFDTPISTYDRDLQIFEHMLASFQITL